MVRFTVVGPGYGHGMTSMQTDQAGRTRIENLDRFDRAKLIFMAAAFVSLVLSVGLWFSGQREEGLFVGLWVPAIHSLGTLVLTGERDR